MSFDFTSRTKEDIFRMSLYVPCLNEHFSTRFAVSVLASWQNWFSNNS